MELETGLAVLLISIPQNISFNYFLPIKITFSYALASILLKRILHFSGDQEKRKKVGEEKILSALRQKFKERKKKKLFLCCSPSLDFLDFIKWT